MTDGLPAIITVELYGGPLDGVVTDGPAADTEDGYPDHLHMSSEDGYYNRSSVVTRNGLLYCWVDGKAQCHKDEQ